MTTEPQVNRTLWDELGWRGIFLIKVPSLPIILLGAMIAVVGITPHDSITVVYFGVGFAAVIGLILTRVSLPAIRHPRQRILLCGAVVVTTILASAIDANFYVWMTGLILVLLGLAFVALQGWVRSTLTAHNLFAYHVFWSPAIDYAAIYGIDSDGHIEKQLDCVDTAQILLNLGRFALPPQDCAQQVAVWDDIAARAIHALEELNRTLASSGQGHNARVVFDVDMGGFVYLRLHPNRFLFAATLDQRYLNDNSFDADVLRLYQDYMRRVSVQQA